MPIIYLICAFLLLLLLPVVSRGDGFRAALIRLGGVASFLLSGGAFLFPFVFSIRGYSDDTRIHNIVFAAVCFFGATMLFGNGLALINHRGSNFDSEDRNRPGFD